MKKYLLLLLLSPLFSSGQSKGYFMLSAGMSKYTGTDGIFNGSFGFGAKFKSATLGLGFNLMQFKNDPNLYIPAYAEFSFRPDKRKPRPFADIRTGIGIYDNSYLKGGFYFAMGGGVLLPVKTHDFFFLLSYMNSTFTLNVPGLPKSTANKDGFLVGFGFWL